MKALPSHHRSPGATIGLPTAVYLDTVTYVKSTVKALGIVIAAVLGAVIFGVGVPLLWVWLASRVQSTTGYGVSGLAALIVVVGPLASYFALVFAVNRFSKDDGRVHRMAWMRSRDEVRESAKVTTSFEKVLILATFLVLLGFNIWFFFFAQCPSTQCFGQ